jgi:hypothetical protein
VNVKEIENEALALSETSRAGLVWRLLQSLPACGLEVSDDEVLKRCQELESGAVNPISHEEFVRHIEGARGR